MKCLHYICLLAFLHCINSCDIGEFLHEGACKNCKDNCKACTNFNDCSKCMEGYFNITDVCFKCKDNCNKCSYFDDCTSCEEGFIISDNECLPCPEKCKNCTSVDECKQCNDGYFMSYRKCTECKDGCQKCIALNKCTNCKEGYFLTIYDNCKKCPTANCVICNEISKENECIKCASKFFLSKQICQKCSIECESCSDNITCTDCLAYYYKNNNNTCNLCSSNCQKCNNSNICELCSDGYYLYNQTAISIITCVKCNIYKCIQCNVTETMPKCAKCTTTYFSNESMCLKCPAYCETCTNEGICIKCLDNYFLGKQTCQECLPHCQICVDNDDCLTCGEGYYLKIQDSLCDKNETCYSNRICFPCSVGCSKCKNTNECFICNYGYYKDQDSKCIECPAGCVTCENNTFCYTCQEHYYFKKKDGECASCLRGCYTCMTSETCQKCSSSHGFNGNYNSGYDCAKCPNECDSCENHICYMNCSFGLISFLDKGYECPVECIVGCEECLDYSRCTTCSVGYYLDLDNQCVQCLSNCIMCTNDANCYQCQKQYYISSSYLCERCSENCYFCRNNLSCIVCMPRYYLVGTLCRLCQYGCLKCDDLFTCNECAPYLDGIAFYLDIYAKSCIECPLGCYECLNSTHCSKCMVGYIMSAVGGCMKCMENCIHCTELSSCRICGEGYYLYESRCAECSKNCLQCVDSSTCINCALSYMLNSTTECELECEVSCIKCLSFKICTQCKDGYYLKNNLCEQCPDYSISCLFDGYNILIYNCTKGYFINLNKCSKIPIQYCEKYDMNSNICLVCSYGYYFTNNGECKPACSPNCLKCNVPFSCSQCQSGYEIINQNECKLNCTANCTKCLNSTYCEKCDPGFTQENGKCSPCDNDICFQNCSTPTDEGCHICDKVYYVNVKNNDCRECNMDVLARSSIEFTFSLCTGVLFDKKVNKARGLAYSGSWWLGTNNSYDICSMPNPMFGVLPIGLYRINRIICKVINESNSRVLELEALSQYKFSQSRVYDSYYTNLYIYSDIESNKGYSYFKGDNGITASDAIRNELTIGDIINVTYEGCDIDIKQCDIYPPPKTGTATHVQSDLRVNEFLINFKNWGDSEEMSMGMYTYKACIQVSPFECLEICEGDATDASEEGILCNINNNKHLGILLKGGIYSIVYKVRYKGPNKGIYSSIQDKIKLLDQFVPDIELMGIKPIRSISDVFEEVNSKRNLVYQFDGVNITRNKYVGYVVKCPPNYCYNEGSCVEIKELLYCACKDSVGELCTLKESELGQLQKYFLKISEYVGVYYQILDVSINRIFEVLNFLSIVPEAVDHSLFSSITQIIEYYSNQWDFEILEKLEDILPNLMASLNYRVKMYVRSYKPNTTEGNVILNDIIRLEDRIQSVVSYVSGHRIFHYIQSFGFNGIEATIFRHSILLHDSNVTIANHTLIGTVINYPYAYSQLFSLKGAQISSNMLSVFAFEEGEFNKLSDDYHILGLMIKDNSSFNIQNYKVRCACYDTGKKALSVDLCKDASINEHNISCECMNARMCFVVITHKPNLKLIGLISLCSIAILLVVYRNKLRNVCRKHRRSISRASLTETKAPDYSPTPRKLIDDAKTD